MKDQDRPYIEFKRIRNIGVSPRSEKKDSTGKLIRAEHPGEFTEIWRKSLVDRKPPHAPYTWATKDWVSWRVGEACVPVGIGNFDKLPADYPREWLSQLLDAVSVVKTIAPMNRKALKLDEVENGKEAETKRGKQSSSDRGSKAELQNAS